MDKIISCFNINKTYDGLKVLKGINLEVRSGEIVAIDTPQKLKKTIGKDRIEFKLFESLDEGQIRLVKERFDEADVSIEESYFTIRVGDGEEALLDTLKSIIDMDVKVKGTKVLRPTLDDVYLK